jgi:pyroglutamyl-peptidase
MIRTTEGTAQAEGAASLMRDRLPVQPNAVAAARRDVRILVTGFGAFPGAPTNPTEALIARLATQKPRLARLGIRLELALLPVVYGKTQGRLTAAIADAAPDAILHFGLAGRRTAISVETRALNRLSILRVDAAGACAVQPAIVKGGLQVAWSRFPAARIAAALRHAGCAAHLSIDAGDYICNQVLYLSLTQSAVPLVGFIHVPPLARKNSRWPARGHVSPRRAGRRLDAARLTEAALTIIRVVAQAARRTARPR